MLVLNFGLQGIRFQKLFLNFEKEDAQKTVLDLFFTITRPETGQMSEVFERQV